MGLLCQYVCATEVHVNYLTSIRYKASALFSVMASVGAVKKVSMKLSRSD